MENAMEKAPRKILDPEQKERRIKMKELSEMRMKVKMLSETIKTSMKERSEVKARAADLSTELGLKPRVKGVNADAAMKES
jgi:hypothetical protein